MNRVIEAIEREIENSAQYIDAKLINQLLERTNTHVRAKNSTVPGMNDGTNIYLAALLVIAQQQSDINNIKDRISELIICLENSCTSNERGDDHEHHLFDNVDKEELRNIVKKLESHL